MLNVIIGNTEDDQVGIFQEGSLASQLNICGIYNSGIEMEKAIKNMRPDVVISDFILRDMDGLGVLKLLTGSNIKVKFIFYSALEDDFIARTAIALGADRVFKKPADYAPLVNLISSYACGEINMDVITKDREERLSRYVSDILKKIGMRPNLLGFNYLLDIILLLVRKDNVYPYFHRMGAMYEQLADKYGKRPNCIERNIRNSIETAWMYGDIEYINSLFGFSVRPDKGKPTNSEFIGFICDYISNNFE